jgi:hypothetical protein
MTKTISTPSTNTTSDSADTTGGRYPFAGITLSPAEMNQILKTLQQLRDGLPAMPTLTPTERKRISKLGTRSRGFAFSAIEAAKADSGLLPQSISLENLLAQDELLSEMSLLQTHLADIKSKLDDSVLLIGSHVYSMCRTVYAVMKTDAAKAKMQEQQAVMKQRFKVTRKKKSQPEASAPLLQ